jgi:hypothetical protein
MKNNSLPFISLTLLCMMMACGEKLSDQYPINKKYWDGKDYLAVINRIRVTKKEEKKPCYADAEKAIVFRKLVDKENVSVVLEDTTLGIAHRADFANGMFDNYREMVDLYIDQDREDKFIYPLEIVEVEKFGLYVQVLYFEIGNENIKKRSDNPNDPEVQNTLNTNVQTLIGNYSLYLDKTKYEDGLTAEALSSYTAGLNEYFPGLIRKYPKADYREMKSKIVDLSGRAKGTELKSSLNNLVVMIDALNADTTTQVTR